VPDHDIGGIVGHLRLDQADWDLALARAGAKADELGRHNPNIRVTASTAEALARLEAVAAATGRLQDAQGRVAVAQAKLNDLETKGDASARQLLSARAALAKSTRDEELAQIRLASAYAQVDEKAKAAAASAQRAADAQRAKDNTNSSSFSMSPLLGAGIALGPAAIPIGAVGLGALAGLGPLAATAMLAMKGVANQMAATGTQTTAFSANVNTLKSALTTLEQTAAGGVIKAFGSDMSGVRSALGPLNADVAIYSAQLGKIAANVIPGLLALMHDLSPLFATFGNELVRGSQDFNTWANGTGAVTKFVAYVQANLPTVERVLAELVTTVSHLVQALAPMGGQSLTTIGLLSRAINAIPVNVLQVLIPLVADGYLAFKAYEGITVIFGTVRGAILAFSAAQAVSLGLTKEQALANATVSDGLTGMVGKYGTLAAALGLAAAAVTGALIADKAIADGFKESAAGANVAATALEQYAASGVLTSDTMKTLGASGSNLKDILDETFKQSTMDKIRNFGSGFAPWSTNSDKAVNAMKSLDAGLTQLARTDPKAASAVFASVTDAAAKQGITVDQLKDKLPGYAAAVLALAGTAAIGGSAWDAYNTAQDAAKTAAASATTQLAATTLQMQLENNAAGLLNQALQSLAGQNLNVAQAQTALDSAILTATATLKTNKGSLDEHTAAGIADRQALEGIVSAARAKMQADAQATGSTEKATSAYQANAASILDTIAQQDGLISKNPRFTKAQNDAQTALNESRDAAYDYAQKLLAIPPVVKTQVDLNADAAKQVLADYAARLSRVGTVLTTIGATATAGGGAKPATHASGGFLQEGWNTAGEGSATELMFKQGSSVRVLTHQQSVSMAGSLGGGQRPSPAGPQVMHNHITLQMPDGKVLAQVVNEVNLMNQRRN
jgi:hypothetical protein